MMEDSDCRASSTDVGEQLQQPKAHEGSNASKSPAEQRFGMDMTGRADVAREEGSNSVPTFYESDSIAPEASSKSIGPDASSTSLESEAETMDVVSSQQASPSMKSHDQGRPIDVSPPHSQEHLVECPDEIPPSPHVDEMKSPQNRPTMGSDPTRHDAPSVSGESLQEAPDQGSQRGTTCTCQPAVSSCGTADSQGTVGDVLSQEKTKPSCLPMDDSATVVEDSESEASVPASPFMLSRLRMLTQRSPCTPGRSLFPSRVAASADSLQESPVFAVIPKRLKLDRSVEEATPAAASADENHQMRADDVDDDQAETCSQVSSILVPLLDDFMGVQRRFARASVEDPEWLQKRLRRSTSELSMGNSERCATQIATQSTVEDSPEPYTACAGVEIPTMFQTEEGKLVGSCSGSSGIRTGARNAETQAPSDTNQELVVKTSAPPSEPTRATAIYNSLPDPDITVIESSQVSSANVTSRCEEEHVAPGSQASTCIDLTEDAHDQHSSRPTAAIEENLGASQCLTTTSEETQDPEASQSLLSPAPAPPAMKTTRRQPKGTVGKRRSPRLLPGSQRSSSTSSGVGSGGAVASPRGSLSTTRSAERKVNKASFTTVTTPCEEVASGSQASTCINLTEDAHDPGLNQDDQHTGTPAIAEDMGASQCLTTTSEETRDQAAPQSPVSLEITTTRRQPKGTVEKRRSRRLLPGSQRSSSTSSGVGIGGGVRSPRGSLSTTKAAEKKANKRHEQEIAVLNRVERQLCKAESEIASTDHGSLLKTLLSIEPFLRHLNQTHSRERETLAKGLQQKQLTKLEKTILSKQAELLRGRQKLLVTLFQQHKKLSDIEKGFVQKEAPTKTTTASTKGEGKGNLDKVANPSHGTVPAAQPTAKDAKVEVDLTSDSDVNTSSIDNVELEGGVSNFGDSGPSSKITLAQKQSFQVPYKPQPKTTSAQAFQRLPTADQVVVAIKPLEQTKITTKELQPSDKSAPSGELSQTRAVAKPSVVYRVAGSTTRAPVSLLRAAAPARHGKPLVSQPASSVSRQAGPSLQPTPSASGGIGVNVTPNKGNTILLITPVSASTSVSAAAVSQSLRVQNTPQRILAVRKSGQGGAVPKILPPPTVEKIAPDSATCNLKYAESAVSEDIIASQITSPKLVPNVGIKEVFQASRKSITKRPPQQLPSLKELVEAGAVQPGENVLSLHTPKQTFYASLLPNAVIKGATGGVYTTPLGWCSSVLSSGLTPMKKTLAYQKVMYRGRPLSDFTVGGPAKKVHVQDASAIGSAAGAASQTPVQRHLEQSRQVNSTPRKPTVVADTKRTLTPQKAPLSCTAPVDDLSRVLQHCTINLIDNTELTPSADFLPDNFWTAASFSDVKIPPELVNSVDCW